MKKDDCEEMVVESIWSSQRHLEDKLKQEVHAGWHQRERSEHMRGEGRSAVASPWNSPWIFKKSNQIRRTVPLTNSGKGFLTFKTQNLRIESLKRKRKVNNKQAGIDKQTVKSVYNSTPLHTRWYVIYTQVPFITH